MQRFEARDPEFAARVRDSFARQPMMTTIGATLADISPGHVEIRMPCVEKIGQQHGFVHGGAVATIADSACGYAALSLMPAGVGVLTAEFKINFLAPAAGDELVAIGAVTRAGRTLMVCTGDVFAVTDGARKQVALMVATMMVVTGNDSVRN